MKSIFTFFYISFLLLICLDSCNSNYKESLDRKFIRSDEVAWDSVAVGVKRQILGYDKRIMLVRIDFQENGIGAVHKHEHSQSSYVISGEFEVTINGVTKTLKEGDSFFVPSGENHGAVCTKAGYLIDAFSPAREDFLPGRK